jgi:hypothetical protein
MARKKPHVHTVKSHERDGHRVRSYIRGNGLPTSKKSLSNPKYLTGIGTKYYEIARDLLDSETDEDQSVIAESMGHEIPRSAVAYINRMIDFSKQDIEDLAEVLQDEDVETYMDARENNAVSDFLADFDTEKHNKLLEEWKEKSKKSPSKLQIRKLGGQRYALYDDGVYILSGSYQFVKDEKRKYGS